jgi:hypothetical protein
VPFGPGGRADRLVRSSRGINADGTEDLVPASLAKSSDTDDQVSNLELLDRLSTEYADVASTVVQRAVAGAERRMSTARVQTFVPILVERLAREQLRGLAHPA